MSQDIEISCPKCGQMLSIEAQYAGRKGKCPYCGEHFIIPVSDVELKPAASFAQVSQSSQTIGKIPKDSVYVMTTPEEYRNFAWRRWTARLIDFWVGYVLAMALFYGLAYLSGVTQIGLGFWTWIAQPEHQIIDLVLTTAIAFFSDALVFSIFKTTLGKKICGVSVCDISGHRISGSGYLLRDLNVLFRGECLCIPLLCAIAYIIQYNRVAKGAASSYDEGCTYQARPTRGKTGYDIVLVIIVLVVGGAIRAATK